MRTSGFTLVEMLVGIAVVATLIALTIGGLAGARTGARHSVTLSNLRTHAQALSSYANDHAESWPHFTQPGFLNNTVEGGGLRVVLVSYFDAHQTWHVALADEYYGLPASNPVFFPPTYREAGGGSWPFHTPYHYPCTFIAEPRYWNSLTRLGPSQFRATRVSEVHFASDKSLIVETWPFVAQIEQGRNRSALAAAFVDGGARTVRWNERKSGYSRGDGFQFAGQGAVHFNDSPPVLHTIDGLSGRDK